MATAIDESSATRKRATVPVPQFSFAREYRDFERFRVSITDELGTYQVEVRAWGNAVSIIRAYVECIDKRRTATKALASIYQTGYASVRDTNFRVVALA
ncbi:hypothetical protein [Streptomyces sp. NPDC059874]|uniref:hypothetical protein n=1 Tax=Streptomyces sp. NPDC059874 TaxID=3346983 RepID=UPI003658410E